MPLWARVLWHRFLADGALADRQASSQERYIICSVRWKGGIVCRSQSPLSQSSLVVVLLRSAPVGNDFMNRPYWNSTRVDCRSGSLLLAARCWIELKKY